MLNRLTKRILILATLLCMSTFLFAQGRVTTRKHLFSDFPDKITKVVMSGGEVLDAALRQEVVDRWEASPFEFCTLEEYASLKQSDNWYFLLVTAGQAKGEETPSVEFLTLEKGGADTGDNVALRTEVISLPLRPVTGGSGRELVFLPALVQGIQDFALKAATSEKAAYRGTGWFNDNYDRKGRIRRIYLAEEDLSSSVTERDKVRYIDEDILLCEADKADKAFLDKTFNTLVSYAVSAGTWSWTMLLDAETESLFYIHRHRITPKAGAGFTAGDLRRMARGR